MTKYEETFDQNTGGWWGWLGNEKGYKPLELKNGAVTSRSPWWIDYNHAPPGAGYLHMVMCLNTKGPFGEHIKEAAGPNGFVASGCSRNFTNAKMTVGIKGELIENGAKLVLLIQAAANDTISGWLLNGQPFRVTKDWSEQTITLVPDEKQWTCLGGRHDRTDYYVRHSLKEVLRDVNVNIMLILFPLTIAPMGPIDGDPHILRPERDYPVWRSKLPEGYVTLDTVKIVFS
jgi:hypothetical protein